MNPKRIEVGDVVNVIFSGHALFDCIVDYIPCDSGDVYILVKQQDQSIHYVKDFLEIELVKKAN